METCILIPPELSVILRPTGRRGRLLEMEATLWTNCALRPGFMLLPDDGELRLDRLELFTDLSDKDVRIDSHSHHYSLTAQLISSFCVLRIKVSSYLTIFNISS